jgi:hypothetical protein
VETTETREGELRQVSKVSPFRFWQGSHRGIVWSGHSPRCLCCGSIRQRDKYGSRVLHTRCRHRRRTSHGFPRQQVSDSNVGPCRSRCSDQPVPFLECRTYAQKPGSSLATTPSESKGTRGEMDPAQYICPYPASDRRGASCASAVSDIVVGQIRPVGLAVDQLF